MAKKKKNEAKVKQTKADKILTVIIRVLTVILSLAVVTVLVLGILVYFNVLNIKIFNDIYITTGVKEIAVIDIEMNGQNETTEAEAPEKEPEENEPDYDMSTPYQVTPPDADEYYNNNSKLLDKYDWDGASCVHTESEAVENLEERGINKYPVTTEYDNDGNFRETYEVSGYSSAVHPMYQTYYVSEAGEVWIIMEIGGRVFATPLSYNMEKGVSIVISETDYIVGYDSTKKAYYEHIPNDDVMTVKVVDRIDAEFLEKLTQEEIDKL